MESEKYFCQIPRKFSSKDRRACQIDVDSALNELGMLSTITNSRLGYLKDKQFQLLKEFKEELKKAAPPVRVVHMNSDYVTQFSLSNNSVSAKKYDLSEDSPKTSFFVKQKMQNRRKRNFFHAPYILTPKKQRKLLREQLIKSSECKPDNLIEDRASPPLISCQDSGNKSNPSSPVKSQNSLTSLGCSIFRSRSLDDLEISKLSLNESCELASHGEIDTVSQRISKLHVS